MEKVFENFLPKKFLRLSFLVLKKVPGKFWSRVSLDLGPAHAGYPLHSLRGPPAPSPLRGARAPAPYVQAPYAASGLSELDQVGPDAPAGHSDEGGGT
jgi:hypothetical protein